MASPTNTRRSAEWHAIKVIVLLFVVCAVLLVGPHLRSMQPKHKAASALATTSPTAKAHALIPNLPQPISDEDNDEDDDECDDPAGADDPCAYVREFCDEIGSPINYLELYYCDMKGQVPDPIVVIFALFWLGILFHLLGTTGDEYFCPSLIRISKLLKLPHDVTGVTFLALGNGAPDIFSVFASLSSDDMDIALGGLLGAGQFVVALVFGGVTISSHLVVNPQLFIRDICMYMLAVTGLFITTMDEKIYVFEPGLFIALYATYVGIVFYRHKMKARRHEYKVIQNTAETPVPTEDAIKDIQGAYESEATASEDDDEDEDDVPFHEKSIIMKFVAVVTYPSKIARDYSVPPSGQNDWCKKRAAAFPTFGALLFLFAAEGESMFESDMGSGFLSVYLALILGVSCSILVYLTTFEAGPPKNKFYQGFFIFGGFVMSIIWIYITAGLVVTLLQSLGLTFGVSNAILGITVLAWGNSIGDLVSNITVAMNGRPQMSVSACYAGPMFNMCVGMGTTLLLTTISDSPFTFSMATGNVIAFSSLLLCLCITLAVLWLNKWTSPKKLGYFLIGYYFVFMIITGLNESDLLF